VADSVFDLSFRAGDIGARNDKSTRSVLFRHLERFPKFRQACKFGLEGLVSKRRESTYRAGRSPHWIKVKNRSHPALERVKEAFS
jgi:ATP-dependent DNA ligase